jgi:uncharacterized phage protein gp47/JayE
MAFVDVPIISDSETLKQNALDSLTSNGWTPESGDPEVVVVEALAPAAQNAAEVAAQVPAAVFRKFGTDLAGVPYLAGAPAEAETTWTVVDDGAAHTVPAGTAVQIGGVPFETVNDTPVAAHATSVTGVLVRAIEDGAAGNGLTGTAGLVNSIAWVNTVTLTSTSSGGADAESDTAYQDRLRAELQAAGPPVTDADFAVKALATPGVGIGRATAQTTDPRTVAVAVTDIDGQPLTSPDKTAISDHLQAKREANFVVTVQDADYNYLTVAYSFHPADGYVAETVQDSIDAALRAFLNPAIFGARPASDPQATANAWSNTTTIYASVITALIQDTQGVGHVGTVTLNGSTGDYTLTGTMPLPAVPDDIVDFIGNTLNGSPSITSIAVAISLHPHMAVTGPGIPAGATIVSVGSTSITLSANATATATNLTFTATALIPTVI